MKALHLALAALAVAAAEPAQGAEILRVGHRGAAAYAPENTIASFRKAIALGADLLELDLHQTKDGRIVILHDSTVDRTTDGRGKVKDLLFADVRRLDAGSSFGPEFRGERVPALEEALALLDEAPRVKLVIELKDGSAVYPGIEENLVALVRRAGAEGRVIFKSFKLEVLARLKDLAPAVPRLYVFFGRVPWLGITVAAGPECGDALAADVAFVQPHRLFASACLVRKAHARGLKVVAWDVQTEAAMRKMILAGVDAIETNDLVMLDRVLAEPRPATSGAGPRSRRSWAAQSADVREYVNEIH